MRALAAFAMQVGLHHYGFFGIEGLAGIIIGIIIFIVVVAILWRIMEIMLPKLGLDAGWFQVIKLLLILLLFIVFLHFVGLY